MNAVCSSDHSTQAASAGDERTEYTPTPMPTLEQAQQLFDAKDYLSALNALDRILLDCASDTPTLLLASATCLKLRKYQWALQYSCRIVSKDPLCVEGIIQTGDALKEMGDLHGAIGMYQRALKISPHSANLCHKIAAAYVLVGDLSRAFDYFSIVVRLDPTLAEGWASMGDVLRALNRRVEAIHCYSEAVRLQPNLTQAWSTLGSLAKEAGDLAAAVSHYSRAVKLSPESEDGWSTLANTLREAGDLLNAKRIYEHLIKLNPKKTIFHASSASCSYDTGDMAGAILRYKSALQLDPRNADCLNNMGNAYREKGEIEHSIACYKAALSVNDRHPHAWNNWGNSLKDKGQLREATACYLTACWLLPSFAPAHSNLASVLKEQGMLEAAMREYVEALKIDAGFADAWSNLGNAMKDVGRLEDAVRCYSTAIHLRPTFSDAYCNLASTHKDAGRVEASISLYKRALELKPESHDALANLIHATVLICDWRTRTTNFIKLARSYRAQLERVDKLADTPQSVQQVAPHITLQPFHSLVYPMSLPQMQRLARCYAIKAAIAAQCAGSPEFSCNFHKGLRGRIRIGYVSSDFGNHPLSHLMQSVFGMHDHTKFEVFCYSLSPDDGSQWRKKIAFEVNAFVDVSKLSSSLIAQRIFDDKISILINLNGYTKGARNEVFAMRPAPLQVAYMGFCGTTGASYMDYIVADATVIPEQFAQHYTEKIIYMPHSYFVNDHLQSARFVLNKSALPTRKQFGIPEDKFVFANFNQIYKLDPKTFKVWCNILRRVPNSVLWLLRFPAAGESNIRLAARAFGIADERIIFTDVSLKEEHLCRGPLCDLFLDTTVCNAHTTGCDILWGGVPMLTVAGEKMAARVAASLLVAAGLHECICKDLAEYEDKAVQFATNPKKMIELRCAAESSREISPLFDTRRWVKNFENGLLKAFERYQRDLPADHLHVPDVLGDPATPWKETFVQEPCMFAASGAETSTVSEEEAAIAAYAERNPPVEPAYVLPPPLTVPPATFKMLL